MATVDMPVRRLKPHILWEQQSYDQPSVQSLRDPEVAQALSALVFVSEWQRAKFLVHFPIPPSKAVVIRNAVEPIPLREKSRGPLRLVYASTPFRGLDVLLDSFAQLGRRDAELHIYSGMGLYARPWEDKAFEHLYARARQMPGVVYHGVVPNHEVRAALAEAHILAYPCTWEETSCVALIEAMSAACRAVVPALGALPETAAGFARLYPAIADRRAHAERFARELGAAMDDFWTPESQERLAAQKRFFDAHYSWDARLGEWEALLRRLTSHGKAI
jgi:glycosyltransferase involved in cell wall biosynthesis